MKKERTYKKIRAATGSGLFARHSLWIAADHILTVADMHGAESYRKYYFAEIQALVSHETAGWLGGNITLGAAAAFFILPAIGLLLNENTGTAITLFVIGGALAFFLLINLLAGRTAKLFIQTATSFDRIDGVTRKRTAKKVIAQVSPLILKAQQQQQPAPAPAPASAAATQATPAAATPPSVAQPELTPPA